MDNFLLNKKYINEIEKTSKISISWESFRNSKILITGATGMIGKYLVDVLMYKNKHEFLNCKIIALGRNKSKFKERFNDYLNDSLFSYYEGDINEKIVIDENNVDYVIHLASSTHPVQYSKYPISTITTNVIGTSNILQLADAKKAKRVFFASSVEIYGENRGDVEEFEEDYCGYINCNILRSGYPEGKRAGEALCQAYISEKNMDIVIGRIARAFGPTLLRDDSKAMSQFIFNAVNNQDIVLKSEGKQYFSYIYVGDVVSAILFCLTKGKNGEAYNIADNKYNITLKKLASIIASSINKNVIYELPNDIEKAGFSKVSKAIMNNRKILELGWRVKDDISEKLKDTIDIIRQINI